MIAGCSATDATEEGSSPASKQQDEASASDASGETTEESEPDTVVRQETADPDNTSEAELTPEEDMTEDDGKEEPSASQDTDDGDVSEAAEDTDLGDKPGTIEAISRLKGIKADCESNNEAVVINGPLCVNPYDLTWDYGDLYEKYIDICDWSLVFDADYYMKKFPALAHQYHYDKDLLLRQFQTRGIHEGRQGSENFNVGAYFYNCDQSVYEAFGHDFECYYLYYMLNDKEQSVNATKSEGHEISTQYKVILTKLQQEELDKVNALRERKNVDPLEFDSELEAVASYRAYTNASLNLDGHGWVEDSQEHRDEIHSILGSVHGLKENVTAENTVYMSYYENAENQAKDHFHDYECSKPHYEAMFNGKYVAIGISPTFYETEKYRCGVHFQTFID